jgi:hypothetical protein
MRCRHRAASATVAPRTEADPGCIPGAGFRSSDLDPLNSKNRRRSHERLRIAGVLFEVSSEQAVRLRIVNPLYRPFVDRAVPGKEKLKIGIRLRMGSLPVLDNLKKIYDTGESWSMFEAADHLWISLRPPRHAKPFWVARFDRFVKQVDYYCGWPEAAAGEKTREIVHPVYYPLDQLLLMHFLATRKGIMVHAAGAVRGGKAFIFPGASGAGKSTFSQLLAAAGTGRLLSDERMIVREIADAMQAFGTPWAGTAGIARNGSAPLGGIFFLKHGRGNEMKKLDGAAALERMLPLVSVPWYDPDTMSPIVAFAKRLLASVPVYEMCFTPDRSAVDFFRAFQKTAS